MPEPVHYQPHMLSQTGDIPLPYYNPERDPSFPQQGQLHPYAKNQRPRGACCAVLTMLVLIGVVAIVVGLVVSNYNRQRAEEIARQQSTWPYSNMCEGQGSC
jgi:hypothetical protein